MTNTTNALRWPCACIVDAGGCEYCSPDGLEREFHSNIDLVDEDRTPGARCIGCRRRARLEVAAAIGGPR